MKTLSLNVLLLCGILCLLMVSCQPTHNKESSATQKKAVKTVAINPEDAVVNLVMNLGEVKRKMAEVNRESNGKRHLSAFVDTLPTKLDPHYWVKMAEDNGGSYVAYYTFAVNSKTRDIHYYDPMQDSLIAIEKWRETTPLSER
jgi:hypothetical protein